eukprot:TRINITY_DN24027_c0_g2_i1.p1 TRINITY_DN24027_c0_g2~~TRINITY_DN24027_c0_g2_i1.p1  ORF type:complete len:608 (-),score=145.60 TRINITY_DN24027_c0_g2_i1:38-1840(-)
MPSRRDRSPSGSRRRTRRRGSSRRQTRRSRSRSRSRSPPRTRQRTRGRRERSASRSEAPKKEKRKGDAGSKKEGGKKGKKAEKGAEKTEPAEKLDKAEKPEKTDAVEKPKRAEKTAEKEKSEKAPPKTASDGAAAEKKTKTKKGAVKTEAKKKAKAGAKRDKQRESSESSSGESSYSSYYSSDAEGEQQQQLMNAMMPWMMQGAMMQPHMAASQQPAQAQYPGYGQYPGYAGYAGFDAYGRPYGMDGVPASYTAPPGAHPGAPPGAPPPPPPPAAGAPPPPVGAPVGAPYGHPAMGQSFEERDKMARRLADEQRMQKEELQRKATSERAIAAIRGAISNLQMGQSEHLESLLKAVDDVAEKELANADAQVQTLKREMDRAISEGNKRLEAMRELKDMVKTGEEHIKYTSDLIRQNVSLSTEKDRQEKNDLLENAGLEAQGLSEKYQAFSEEKAKVNEALTQTAKGPGLIEIKLTVAKISKLSSDLRQIAANADHLVREGKTKLERQERSVAATQRMQEIFDKYDADADGFLSRKEVVKYAKGEAKFKPSDALLDTIWRTIVEEGTTGVRFDKFQRLKVSIGIERVVRRDRAAKGIATDDA